MRKVSRKEIVRKLDKLISEIVKERDGKCVTCGSTDRLTAGHIFSRVAYSTRWDLENVWTQCWGCNYRHEFDPYPFQRWFAAKFGQKKLDELWGRFHTPRKFKTHELIELYEKFKREKTKKEDF